MCTLTNAMLRERRICLLRDPYFVSLEEIPLKKLLRDEMGIYSYQFKSAASVFQKDACALSGKVGGFKDDFCVVLQLGVYWIAQIVDQRSE